MNTLPYLHMNQQRAGVAAFDEYGRILLIKRGKSPASGLWTLPMGHVEKGETPIETAQREMLEETGLKIKIENEIGTFYSNGIALTIYQGKVNGGHLQAGDDAVDARWVEVNLIQTLENTNDRMPQDEWAYKLNEIIFAKLYEIKEKNGNMKKSG